MVADKGKEEKIAMRVSRNSIAANFLLSAAKLAAGLAGHSGAMVSDAIHSASDVLSTIVVMVGVKVSSRESDKNHQYGHERLESVAALILAVVLAATGFGIGYNGLRTIIAGTEGGRFTVPTLLPLAAAVVSILVKEGMYWYTIRAAAAIRSDALRADAWHHRSDALSSVGSFIGILGARMGYPIMDSVEAIAGVAKRQQGVQRLDDIKTRMFGNKIYVDIEISVAGEMSLWEAHGIAEKVHGQVEENFPSVKHCMVHVNPCGEREGFTGNTQI